jgi:hypothetical protein
MEYECPLCGIFLDRRNAVEFPVQVGPDTEVIAVCPLRCASRAHIVELCRDYARSVRFLGEQADASSTEKICVR